MTCSDCETENPFDDLEEATENGWIVWSLEAKNFKVLTYEYDYQQKFVKCPDCFDPSNISSVVEKMLKFISSNVESKEICLTIDLKEVDDE